MRRSPNSSRRRLDHGYDLAVRRAAAGGLFVAATLFVANMISGLLFHRDFSSSGDSLHAFISGLISYFIAVLSVGLAAACAAGIWTRLRYRQVRDAVHLPPVDRS